MPSTELDTVTLLYTAKVVAVHFYRSALLWTCKGGPALLALFSPPLFLSHFPPFFKSLRSAKVSRCVLVSQPSSDILLIGV
jgi:hypothetical protein